MKYHPEIPQDQAKYAVGRAAVQRYAHDGARLGLGSGTTSAWFVRALGEAVEDGLQVVGVPTSNFTRNLAIEVGVPLIEINDLTEPLDVTLDGPDEVDHDGDQIKGGGACLLWERMVAEASRKVVCIADDTKLVDQLGRFPMPIEVVQYGWMATERSVRALLVDLGYPADVEIVRRARDGEVVVTDNGNFILDAHLKAITDKPLLDTQLNLIPGVVENGMFTGIVDEILMASPTGDTRLIELPNRHAARRPDWRK